MQNYLSIEAIQMSNDIYWSYSLVQKWAMDKKRINEKLRLQMCFTDE